MAKQRGEQGPRGSCHRNRSRHRRYSTVRTVGSQPVRAVFPCYCSYHRRRHCNMAFSYIYTAETPSTNDSLRDNARYSHIHTHTRACNLQLATCTTFEKRPPRPVRPLVGPRRVPAREVNVRISLLQLGGIGLERLGSQVAAEGKRGMPRASGAGRGTAETPTDLCGPEGKLLAESDPPVRRFAAPPSSSG